MTLRLSEAARDDLRAIYAYYAERNPASADRVVGTILKAANGLTSFPLLGKYGAVEGTRERLVTRYPYRIIYSIEDDSIVVLRIIHGAQQWP
ncbi:MAG TPA: type II toxin-antitoxin system RelE/ParE family toxin [Chloroflexota bacterium]|nr:type II toxin-antitoxin system RelE/ParE family toxin [Chloroflexota bacterium]